MLAAVLIVSRLCHTAVLWAEETLPLAAARQMRFGRALYRAIWFDKPPLAPLLDWAIGARADWPLRLTGALYCLLACWIVYRFARDLWGEREGLWAAGLLGFFLVFDFPSSTIPLAADQLMLAPHLAAVWLAFRRRPFWSGLLAGIALLANPKGVLVLAACVAWNPAGALWMAAGFAVLGGASAMALPAAYWDEVWRWGRIYAGSTFVEAPIRNGLIRTLSWLGFHSGAGLLACGGLSARHAKPRIPPARRSDSLTSKFLLWTLLSLVGVLAGLRFFPRYYFQLLPILVLLAARGAVKAGRNLRIAAALLLLIPAVRFGPTYFQAIRNQNWRDTAMDRDSRAAAAMVRQLAKPGDTLLVWGYRPEIYVYAGLPAATMYLDSQPLTGVPADRHLTQSAPVETEAARTRRAEVARSNPTFVLDGLGPYNPYLAITAYPDLQAWFAGYEEIGRSAETRIFRRKSPGSPR